jgi:hypothetical protein
MSTYKPSALDLLKQTFQSYYSAYDREPKQVALDYLLNLDTRFFLNKEKRELPCFQPHFSGWGRAKDKLTLPTGLLQLDYDYKDNPRLSDDITRERLIDELIDSDYILCAQTSAGGKGVWALLMVDGITKENFTAEADKALNYAIERYGLLPDEKVTRNPAALRFLSPYKDMKTNEEATYYNA